VEASLHLNHPRFLAQQVAAPIPLAVFVECVVAALNQSLAVWDMSPAGTPIDRDLADRFKRLFRYPKTAEVSMVPGGSFATLTALLAARGALEPEGWNKGGARVAVITGEQTHYSVSRAVGILGLGSRSVFKVTTDETYSTDVVRVPAAFRAARKAGFRKSVLIGTAGSTPTGSFDDLETLADLARQAKAWFHVDAAHGGGLAFSKSLRHLLRGIERADSIAFDPHKMLFMPLAASAVLVREGKHLRNAFEQDAPYLFGNVAREFSDIGPFTIACSQRFDALKTWLTWKVYSDSLWHQLTTGVCDVAQAAYDFCAQSRVLEPVHKPQSNILCFRLRIPPRSIKASDQLHWRIKEATNSSGYTYISSTVLDSRRVLRIVVMNPRTSPQDAVDALKKIEQIAQRQRKRSLRHIGGSGRSEAEALQMQYRRPT
jgi:L-2,4-diaminobutyrate decarboxylase